jgi:NTE family protein
LAPGRKNSDELMVILTFSGGGTRAAALSYGVMEKLRDTPITINGETRSLLDGVDIISSVSGGSLPSAVYALYGEEMFNFFPDEVLYANIQSGLIRSVFNVKNYSRLASPFYGRSDMLAEDFDSFMQHKTYADLIDRGTRPFVMINTTDLAQGNQFSFVQDHFDYLYSDLSTYPLSRAMAASAAVPGVLSTMSLTNYEQGEDYIHPNWITYALTNTKQGSTMHTLASDTSTYLNPKHKYLHLVDGGVSDNLGLLPIVRSVLDMPGAIPTRERLAQQNTKKVVIFTVNAITKLTNDFNIREKLSSLYKIIGIVTTTPMDDFTDAQIAYMRLLVDNMDAEQKHRDEMRALIQENGLSTELKYSVVDDIDYEFIEVSLNNLENYNERKFLQSLPTSFVLSQDEVDRLRVAASTLLNKDTNFQALVNEFK